jgi:PAS domain S-box-containing protein
MENKNDIVKRQLEILCKVSKLVSFGAWELDLEENIQICSPEVVAIREDDPENIVVPLEYGLKFYTSDYRNIVANALQKIIQLGGTVTTDAKFISAKGNEKWVRSEVFGVLENGNVTKVYGVLKDITKEREQEDLTNIINNELGNFKYALDHTSIVAITDKKGIITYVNKKFCAISGYSSEELIGKTHKIINSGHHDNEFFKDLWLKINSGIVWEGEIKNKKKSGEFYWVHTYIIPLLDDQLEPQSYLSIRQDITKRKNQEYFISKSLEEKEVLLNEIHHRVKNNLQIVSSLMTLQSNIINNQSLTDLYMDMKNRIIAMSLIHDTIYQTKNYDFINASIYFHSIINNLKNSVNLSNMEIELYVHDNYSLGVSTSTNIGIILNEAVSNAVKHAFKNITKNPLIKIKLKRDENIQNKYELEIKDNGSGFYNVSNELSSQRTSLGLSLIDGLASQMNGSFSIFNNGGCIVKVIFFDNKKS